MAKRKQDCKEQAVPSKGRAAALCASVQACKRACVYLSVSLSLPLPLSVSLSLSVCLSLSLSLSLSLYVCFAISSCNHPTVTVRRAHVKILFRARSTGAGRLCSCCGFYVTPPVPDSPPAILCGLFQSRGVRMPQAMGMSQYSFTCAPESKPGHSWGKLTLWGRRCNSSQGSEEETLGMLSSFK